MYKFIKAASLAIALVGLSGLGMSNHAFAGAHTSWKVSSDESVVYFGSVKKGKVGEVHSFSGVTGTVDGTGKAVINIDLSTVETNIAIRNKRMGKHVFNVGGPNAVMTAQLDMDALNAIAVGSTGTVAVEGMLSVVGVDTPIKTSFFVVHLSDNKVIATTDSMIMLSIAKSGLTAGVDMLQKLAKLPDITRVSPVTIRLTLTK